MKKIFNVGQEYLNDFEEIIHILEKGLTDAASRTAVRLGYASISSEEAIMRVVFDRADREKIFRLLAVYGNALSSVGGLLVGPVGSQPMGTTLFALLTSCASFDEVPQLVVSGTINMIRAFSYAVEHNDEDTDVLRPLLSAAFLNRNYVDEIETITALEQKLKKRKSV